MMGILNQHLSLLRFSTVFACITTFAVIASPNEQEGKNSQAFTIEWTGKMMTVHRDGDASPRADLEVLARKPGSFAIGPLAGLRGEITVLDGKAYIARVVDGKERVTQTWEHQAPFLVYGRIDGWLEIEIPNRIKSYPELEKWLPAVARAQGIDVSKPFSFKLELSKSKVKYHIIANDAPGYKTTKTHRELMKFFELDAVPVSLIGVFSTMHAGIFTHHGSSTHIHMVSHDKLHSGHVESIAMGEDAKLFLPVSQTK